MKSRKLISLILAAVMVLGLFAGCGSSGTDTSTEAAANAAEATAAPADPNASKEDVVVDESRTLADTINLGVFQDPESFNPWLAAHDARQQIYYNTIFEPLAQLNTAGELELILAKDLVENDDGSYTVTIWDDIYDSEGNHITASDVVFSYQACVEVGQLAWGVRYLDHFDIVDDYTLTMYMADESAVGLNMLLKICFIVSQAAYEASPDQFATTPVGTGPYKLESYTPGSSATIVARDDYWQDDESAISSFSTVGSIKTINFSVITDSSQMALALEMGTIDAVAGNTGLSSVDLDFFLDDNRNALAGYNAQSYMGSLIYQLELNCGEKSPLQDVRVRQAIAYAIDVDALIENVFGVDGGVATTNSSPFYADYDPALDSNSLYPYDPDQAKALLEEAGYADGLTVKLLLQTTDLAVQMSTLITSYLSQVGITCEVSNTDAALFNSTRLDTEGDKWDIIINQVMSINTPGRFSTLDINAFTTGLNGLYLYDETLQSLFLEANLATSYSTETVTALLNYVDENCFLYPLGWTTGYVITDDNFASIVLDRNSALIYGQCVVYAD